MAYADFKDLARRTAADKVLRDETFSIVKDPKYDGYQRGLPSMVYKLFDKKTAGGGVKSMLQNELLAEELHKPIIRKFKKRKVYSAFKDNIWGADLADTQLISKFNKGFRFLLCVIDIFSKYAGVVPLKDKKSVNAFQSILRKFSRKPNKIWVDKGSEFYNNSFQKLATDTVMIFNDTVSKDTVMYATYSEGKSVVAERFIRTLKNKIYKYMTSISKNVYIGKLDDIVNEYNNT